MECEGSQEAPSSPDVILVFDANGDDISTRDDKNEYAVFKITMKELEKSAETFQVTAASWLQKLPAHKTTHELHEDLDHFVVKICALISKINDGMTEPKTSYTDIVERHRQSLNEVAPQWGMLRGLTIGLLSADLSSDEEVEMAAEIPSSSHEQSTTSLKRKHSA